MALEIQTTAPMKALKDKGNWQDVVNPFNTEDYPQVKQVTVSVAQSPKNAI